MWFSYLSDCNAQDQNFMGGFHIFLFNAQLFWTYTRCTDYLMSCLTGVFVFLHVFLPATILPVSLLSMPNGDRVELRWFARLPTVQIFDRSQYHTVR